MHWFSYELGIRRTLDAKALRMGTAFHDALEALSKAGDFDAACDCVRRNYSQSPESFDETDWRYEEETVIRMVCGYEWRWRESGIEYLAAEAAFELPLVNPDSGRRSQTFNVAGKIDGIVRLPDGRLAVIEHKLFGDDIGPDAPLWRRMRLDPQPTLYVMAARQMGYDIDTILYDVARKPTIKPTAIPLLDELGAKIVLNGEGIRVKTERGLWRQTGDPNLGYVLQQRMPTPEEWGDKLADDIASRPEFYFQRVEIPRLSNDIREYSYELWDIAKTIREAQLSNRWYRSVSKNTCPWCAYFDLCGNRGFDPAGELPEGFMRVQDFHPELGRTNDSRNGSAPETQGTAPAPCESAAAG